MFKELQKRVEISFILTLFIPTILEAMERAYPGDALKATAVLNWGLVVVFLVLIYLLLEGLKDTIPPGLVKAVDLGLLTQIALFIPVFIGFAYTTQATIPAYAFYSFQIGLVGVMVIPIALALLLGICVSYMAIKDAISGS